MIKKLLLLSVSFCLASMTWGQGSMLLLGVGGPGGGGGGSSVTFDVLGAGTQCSSGTTCAVNHTVTNATPNSAVVVVLHWIFSSANVTSCTYNSASMTQMWNSHETGSTINIGSAGYIIANGTGNGTALSVSCTLPTGMTSNTVSMDTLSFANVNQSTLVRTPPSPNLFDTGGTGGTETLTVTNATSGDMVVDGITSYSQSAAITTNSPGTRKAATSSNNIGGNGFSGSSSVASATGSTTMSYTLSTGEWGTLGAAAIAHN